MLFWGPQIAGTKKRGAGELFATKGRERKADAPGLPPAPQEKERYFLAIIQVVELVGGAPSPGAPTSCAQERAWGV